MLDSSRALVLCGLRSRQLAALTQDKSADTEQETLDVLEFLVKPFVSPQQIVCTKQGRLADSSETSTADAALRLYHGHFTTVTRSGMPRCKGSDK